MARLEEARKSAELERERGLKAVEDRFSLIMQKIEELELMMLGDGTSDGIRLGGTGNLKPVNHEWPGIRSVLRRWAEKMPDSFRLDDVVAFIDAEYPSQKVGRTALATELWRMCKNGNVRLIEKGGARRPALYGKVGGS